MTALSEEQIAVFLGKLNGWKYEDRSLRKGFKCRDFRQATEFAVALAKTGEKENHYPELVIKENIITVTLFTPSENGVTGKDFLLAEQFEKWIIDFQAG